MRKQIFSFTMEPELEKYVRRMAEMEHITVGQYIRNVLWTGYDAELTAQEAKEDGAVNPVEEMFKNGDIKF